MIGDIPLAQLVDYSDGEAWFSLTSSLSSRLDPPLVDDLLGVLSAPGDHKTRLACLLRRLVQLHWAELGE